MPSLSLLLSLTLLPHAATAGVAAATAEVDAGAVAAASSREGRSRRRRTSEASTKTAEHFRHEKTPKKIAKSLSPKNRAASFRLSRYRRRLIDLLIREIESRKSKGRQFRKKRIFSFILTNLSTFLYLSFERNPLEHKVSKAVSLS